MNFKNLCKKTISIALASAMVISMTGCSKSGKEQTNSGGTEVKKEFVWVPEFYDLASEGSFYNSKVNNGYLYYQNYEWDEVTQKSSYSIESISLADGKAGSSIPIGLKAENAEEAVENSKEEAIAETEVEIKEVEDRSVSGFVPTDDGVETVEAVYHWNEETGESKSEFYLCKYDLSGTRVSEMDITETMTKDENNSWISDMQKDGEGRIYLAADTAIFLFDAAGNYQGTVSAGAETWINSMGVGKDGKMYISYYNMNGAGMTLQEVDFEGKALGATYENLMNSNGSGSLIQGIDKDFLIVGSNCLYQYDLATQSTEELLNWLDCDINGSYVDAVYALEDGRIACISNNWETNKGELAILSKKPASEVKEKINITIAGLYSDSSIQSEAVKFNKSNDTYRISLKEYFDYNDVVLSGEENNYEQVMQDAINRLNNDITSDNCPDMLMLNGINIERFAAKGVFEDLNSWLDNSTKVAKADYFENILEAYTYDGVLVAIPKSFELMTLVGKASELGEEPGWTVAQMVEYSKKHPDAELISYLTKEYALELMLQYNQGSYVNWETGECNFNNESFIGLLEFAEQFPEKYEYKEDEPSEPTKIGNGKLLLSQTYLYDFQSIQMPAAHYDNDVCFIGYPNENGDSGTYLQASTGLAMTAKSDCKEGAWAFLENYLTNSSEEYSYGFSSKKADFAKAKEEALKVEYLKDENGEIMKDENGEPILANGGGTIGYGDDWTYTYHATTEEEADLIEELIGIAKPATVADVTILNIVKEEAGAFFKGQRSATDVASIIQSRVQVYVNENR